MDLEEEERLTRFEEFLKYPQVVTIENLPVLPEVAMLVINKAVNLNGGYLKIEKRLRTNRCKETSENVKQFNTVYGRTNLRFFQDLINKLLPVSKQVNLLNKGLKEEPKMIDLGSGLGTLVFYFALTTGYNATGIEFNPPTYSFSTKLKVYIDYFIEESRITKGCGKINLIKGDLFDKKYENLIMNHSIWFMNNAKETFSARSIAIGEETLDSRLIKIFLKMKVGSQLVAFEKLPLLDYYSNEIDCEEVLSCRRPTSWTEISGARIIVYIYKIRKNYWRCPICFNRNDLIHHQCVHVTCTGKIARTKGYVLRKKTNNYEKWKDYDISITE